MAEETITAGQREVIIPLERSGRFLLEVFQGQRAYLGGAEIGAGTAGQRIDVGRSTIIDSGFDDKHTLFADGADVEYQLTELGKAEPGRQGASPAPSTTGGSAGGNNVFAVNKAYVTNVNPGANSDILSSDISPDNPGTLEVRVALDSSAVFALNEDGKVYDLNRGTSLNSGADYGFSINVGDNVTYNFQVESAVTVNRLRATFSRGLNI